MSTIAVIGDVHDQRERLGRVLSWLAPAAPDLALLAGDVGIDPPWSAAGRRMLRGAHDASVRAVIGEVHRALRCPVAFVPGNHDLADPVSGLEGTNCDRSLVEIAGVRVAGFGGAGPARFGFPYEWDELEAERALERLGLAPGTVDVALCHTPPAGSRLDRIHRGEHAGSRAVRRWIAEVRPALFICGHIHEAWGVEAIEGVPCLNAGALGEPFGQEIGWLVTWEHGAPAAIRWLGGGGDAPREEAWSW